MKKTEQAEFADFLFDEAKKFGKPITAPEVDLWFETFKRATLPDFKNAIVMHKRDPKQGGWMPTINQVQRLLRMSDENVAATDWRCAEEISGQRCGYPGGISTEGARNVCSAHYRIKGSSTYSEAGSLQIIDQSRSYVPPKTLMDLMERGAAQRAADGERWRKARGIEAVKRRPEDAIAPSVKPREDMEADAHVAAADHAHLDEVNAALAMAGGEGE